MNSAAECKGCDRQDPSAHNHTITPPLRQGIVLFVAPTRPLVKQQYESCRAMMGIPDSDLVLLTGTSGSTVDRKRAWASGRVFFCTPHVVVNDLKTGRCPGEAVVAIVVDECHRATGGERWGEGGTQPTAATTTQT
jgi:ERCC4-related helicase